MTSGNPQAAASVGTASAAPAAAPQQKHQHTPEPPRHALQVLPLRYTKVIHFIRHGEGYHNIAGRKDHDNYKSYDYEDSHLSAEGWRQAHALGAHITAAGIRPEVVVVSPLTRAIETAVGCFGDHIGGDGGASEDDGGSSGSGSGGGGNGNGNGNGAGGAQEQRLLMVALEEVPGRRAAHPAVPLGRAPPFVCLEGCREHLGVHPCDRRFALSSKKAMFPGVDFSLIASEEDDLWLPDHRETKEEIQARGRAFMAELMARPEREIAVVTHSSFVHYALTCYGYDASTAVQGDLHRWYENAELRSVVLADPGATGRPADPTHFPGFASSVVEGPQV